jgi:hypothetical protein
MWDAAPADPGGRTRIVIYRRRTNWKSRDADLRAWTATGISIAVRIAAIVIAVAVFVSRDVALLGQRPTTTSSSSAVSTGIADRKAYIV